MNFSLIFSFSAALLLSSAISFAEEPSIAVVSLADRLSSMIKKTLEEKITHSEVEIQSFNALVESTPLKNFQNFSKVRLLDDKPNGVAILEVTGDEGQTQVVQTPYTAWMKVPVATHRIYPNTKLKAEDFKVQSINVASGPAREYRGIMASETTPLAQMESRQSILEGQFLTTAAIQKQPDLRKGDLIKLELNSGELSLTTQAVAQEPASVGDKIRVLTLKTKKEIVGLVKEDHSVEVNL